MSEYEFAQDVVKAVSINPEKVSVAIGEHELADGWEENGEVHEKLEMAILESVREEARRCYLNHE